MKLTIKKMDLFKSQRKVLVQCISRDCEMGEGIAKTFDKKFPDMKSSILTYLDDNTIGCPITVGYETNDLTVILNMVTKGQYFHKPTYNNFRRALENVKEICIQRGYSEIAMPKIGCGLDGLSWSKVQDIIKEVFKDTDIDILICILQGEQYD